MKITLLLSTSGLDESAGTPESVHAGSHLYARLEVRFARDSLVEQRRFELSVPA
jgi:hypothetical protein